MKSTHDGGKVCAVCRFSLNIPCTCDMLCRKRGVVPEEYNCRKFIYDPLKRKPRKLPGLSVPDELIRGDI